MKKLAAVLVIILLCINVNVINVKADADSGGDIVQTKNYSLGKKMNLKGVFPSDSMYFSVQKSWSVKKVTVNLIFNQSELLSDEDTSALTVYVNDNPVHSFDLTGKGINKETISFDIQPEDVKTGVNSVRLQMYRRISKKPCSDDVNAANWITFYEKSFIQVDFTQKKPENKIGDFPYPFIKGSDENSIDTELMLPDKFSDEEAEAALLLASGIGQKKSSDDTSLQLKKYSDADNKNDTNLIYVGKGSDTPKEILALFSAKELEAAGKTAVIKIADSPYNADKKILCIISNGGGNYLTDCIKFLFNDNLVYQIQSDSYTLSSSINYDTKAKTVNNKFTMSSLGYNGISFKGPFRQQTTIGVKFPKNRVLQTGGKIVLNMRYSKNLDFDKALASVYINDIPVGSKKLTLEKADGDTLTLNIPDSVIKGSYYEVKIAFDLEMPNAFCTFRQEEMPWAYITNDSYVYMPTIDNKKFLFENYPSTFIKDCQWNDSLVILPDNPSGSDLNIAANVMSYMGKELETNRGSLNVIKSSEFNKNYYDKQLIVIGTPAENSFIKQLNSSLWFKYNDDYSGFASNEKKQLVDSYSKELGAIELIPSPYNSDSNALVVTAPKEDNLGQTAKFLCSSALMDKLNGDCALIDKSGQNSNFYFRIYKDSKDTAIGKFINTDTKSKLFIMFFAAIMILAVLIITGLVRKRNKVN